MKLTWHDEPMERITRFTLELNLEDLFSLHPQIVQAFEHDWGRCTRPSDRLVVLAAMAGAIEDAHRVSARGCDVHIFTDPKCPRCSGSPHIERPLNPHHPLVKLDRELHGEE